MDTQEKKQNNNGGMIVFIIICIFVIIISLVILFQMLNKPKADYETFNTKVTTYLQGIENVKSYRKSSAGNDVYYITIDEKSWKGSEIDKVTYCDNIRKAFTGLAWENNIINENATISVIFETEKGIRLAEPDGVNFGTYKIFY